MNVFTRKSLVMTGLLIAPLLKTEAQDRAADSIALRKLYNNTAGPNWTNKTNWLSGTIDTWYGITLTSGRVTKISLPSNGLAGTYYNVPGELSALKELDLSNNSLTGTFPYMGNANLQVLNLSNNQLSGSIPSWNNWNGMKNLNLSHNSFSGVIKDYSFPVLEYLDLSYNQFSGNVVSLGDGLSIISVNQSHNQFTGGFGNSWPNNPDKLTYYDVSYNMLSGGLPWMPWSAVTQVNVSHNNFSGSNNWYPFPGTAVLDMSYNKFDGDINGSFTKIVKHNKYTFAKLEGKWLSNADPQDTILPLQLSAGQLSVAAGGTVAKNTYKWYTTGDVLVATNKGNASYTPTQSGDYYVKVTNDEAPGVTLTSTIQNITTLPVTLLSFKATAQGNSVKLVWETADEQKLDFYAVERSTDGQNWPVIGTIKSKSSQGSLAKKLDYSYLDNTYSSVAACYYRLKQVDNDGAFKYSEVVSVKHSLNTPTASISVYPNPSFGNVVNIALPEVTALTTQIKVADATGRVLKIVTVSANTSSLQLNRSELQSGIYHIFWVNGNKKCRPATLLIQ